MSLELIFGVLLVAAIAAVGLILGFAKGEAQPVAVVPVKFMDDAPILKPIDTTPPLSLVQEELRQSLERKVVQLEEQVAEGQEILRANDTLRFDNLALKKELTEMTDKYRALVVDFDAFKHQSDAQISGFIKEKEILLDRTQGDTNAQLDNLNQEVDDLRRMVEKLKDLNKTQTTKSDMLQYELIKSRAQSTGFERIGLNYRKQLEDLMGQMQGVSQEYSQLSQHKNRLETTLDEMKQAHEELTRREKLLQFELSKTQQEGNS